MMNIILKKYIRYVLIIGVFASSFYVVSAEGVNNTTDATSTLQSYIATLLQEVSRLQQLISVQYQGHESSYIFDADEVVESGVSWIKNSQEINGHFKYEYIPFLDRYNDDDNIVRQAGTLYVLGEVYTSTREDIYGLESAIVNSIRYFESQTIEDSFGGYDFNCVLKKRTQCSLGATSLALLGVLDLLEVNPELSSRYGGLAEGYKNYLMAMKQEGTGFRTYYYTSRTQKNTESSFSTGEAFLALARYQRYQESEEITTVLDDTFEYFRQSEMGKDTNLYLWAMAGIKTLHADNPKSSYVEYAELFTDSRITGASTRRSSGRNRCAYIEGVVSAYDVLEGDVPLYKQNRYREEIDFWLNKSSTLQIEDDAYMHISVNGGAQQKLVPPDMNLARGGFLSGTNEPVQRIDFTQHCVSAYLQAFDGA